MYFLYQIRTNGKYLNCNHLLDIIIGNKNGPDITIFLGFCAFLCPKLFSFYGSNVPQASTQQIIGAIFDTGETFSISYHIRHINIKFSHFNFN